MATWGRIRVPLRKKPWCGLSELRSFSADAAWYWDASAALSPLPQASELNIVEDRLRRMLTSSERLVEKRLYFSGRSNLADLKILEMRGFVLVDCSVSRGQLAAEKRLPVDIMSFAWQRAGTNQNACVGLITADRDSAYLLSKLRDLGLRTVVVYPDSLSHDEYLLHSADVAVNWKDLLLTRRNELSDRSVRYPGGDGTIYNNGVFHPAVDSRPEGALADFNNSIVAKDTVVSLETSDFRQPENIIEPIIDSSHSRAVVGEIPNDANNAESVSGKLKEWRDLSFVERTAAGVLGYTDSAWDNGDPTIRSSISWAVLAKEERDAATILGYAGSEWDAELLALAPSNSQNIQPRAIDEFVGKTGGRVSGRPVAENNFQQKVCKSAFNAMIGHASTSASDSRATIIRANENPQIELTSQQGDFFSKIGEQPLGLSPEFAEAFADDLELGFVANSGPDEEEMQDPTLSPLLSARRIESPSFVNSHAWAAGRKP